MKASIVIPVFNRAELTKGCWSSVLQQTPVSIAYEVVFVDNASTDATAQFLREIAQTTAPLVRVLVNRTNLGFSKACNQGAKLSSGNIIVFLNNDTIVHDDWLSPLVEELEMNIETGVVGARLLYPDGRIQHAGVCIDRKAIPYHIFQHAPGDDPRVVQRRAFRMVTGACMAVRRTDFLAMGGFDEDYINGHEDVDFCLRVTEAGRKVVYRPDCVVTHFESQSDGRMEYCRINTEKTMRRWNGKLMQDDFMYDFPESERRLPKRRLSLAIKIPATDKRAEPDFTTKRAEMLARLLSRRGHRVQIHYSQDWGRDDCEHDITIVMPSKNKYAVKPYSKSVLWIESKSELAIVSQTEFGCYQMVFCRPDVAEELEAREDAPLVVSLDYYEDGLSSCVMDAIESALVPLATRQTMAAVSPDPGAQVSVLMATYNRRDTLARAIASVLAQTVSNWELIVVNDGGEPVGDIVEQFNEHRIVYLDINHCSKGQAINTAFSVSKGSYVAYLDDDDIWYQDHLERALFFLRNIPEVEMTYSDTVETTLEYRDGSWRQLSSVPVHRPQINFSDLLECNCIPGITVVHTRSLYKMVGGMDPSLEVLVDFDMWRRLALITEPYHISAATAEHYIKPSMSTTGQGQITNLHMSNPRRYLANVIRILRKNIPEKIDDIVRYEQYLVRKKVQSLFLHAQGDYFKSQGNYKRAASCYKLASNCSLSAIRKRIYHQL